MLVLFAKGTISRSSSQSWLMADDPAAPLDLPAWCHLTGHDYLDPVTSPPGPAYAIRVAADAKPVDDRRGDVADAVREALYPAGLATRSPADRWLARRVVGRLVAYRVAPSASLWVRLPVLT
jgi:hypothetical protein